MVEPIKISKYLVDFFINSMNFDMLNFVINTELKTSFEKYEKFYDKLSDALKTDDWEDYEAYVESSFDESVEVDLDAMLYQIPFISFLKVDNLSEFTNRASLLFLYSELEQYFFKCFKYILLKYPNIIEDKSITIQRLLKKDKNIDLVIEEKVEHILNKIFFEDFTGIFKYAKKVLNINHQISEEDCIKLNELRQIRNAYIHGDGTVSFLFLSKVKSLKLKLGEKIPINRKILREFFSKTSEILTKFDVALLSQFNELEA